MENTMIRPGRPRTWEELAGRIGGTPLVPVEVRIGGRRRNILLKIEACNPLGSIKDRTAYSLIMEAEARRPDQPITIVESTSGNLGAALAAMCELRGHTMIAVVDPKTSPQNLGLMERFGARIEMVHRPDRSGGYLHERLARVREICAREDAYWTNQYASAANPGIHFRETGPEMVKDAGPDVDCCFIAVSTGGTLAGIAGYFRSLGPQAKTKVIAVDAVGSVALGGRPARRHLTGFGASRPSEFMNRMGVDGTLLIPDAETIAVCRKLADETGLRLGASSGAVVAACVAHLARNPDVRKAVCLCPDGGVKYTGTVYDDDWADARGIDVRRALDRYEGAGVWFSRPTRDSAGEGGRPGAVRHPVHR